MKALSVLALLAITSPGFAEVPAEKQSVSIQGQKPFLYDKLLPKRLGPPAPESVEGTTITAGGDKTYVYDSAREQLPSQQPIITPYSLDNPRN
jgi:hypothetical protein